MYFKNLDSKYQILIHRTDTLLGSRHAYTATQQDCQAITQRLNTGAQCITATNYAVEKNENNGVYHTISVVAYKLKHPLGSDFAEVLLSADGRVVFKYQASSDVDFTVIYYEKGDWENDLFILAGYESSNGE